MTRTIAGNPPELDSDPNELEGVPRVRIHNGSSRVVKPGSQCSRATLEFESTMGVPGLLSLDPKVAFAGESGARPQTTTNRRRLDEAEEILRTPGLRIVDGRFPAAPRSRLHGRVQGGSLDLRDEARGRFQLNVVH